MSDLDIFAAVEADDKPAKRMTGAARGASTLYYRFRAAKVGMATVKRKGKTLWMTRDEEAREWLVKLAELAELDVAEWAA